MPSRPTKSINCAPRNTSALALSPPERRQLGADGFVAAGVQSSQQLVLRAKNYVDSISEPLQKYMFLQHLQTIDPPLYVQLLMDYTTEMCPLVYTPTVGLACQRWSDIYFSPQGLYIPITEAGRVDDLVARWPHNDVDVIVFTDGGRILGLGDLAANGMGIPIGKLSLYVACAGVDPSRVLPVTLDFGTDNEELLNDPMYIGLRQPRSHTSVANYDAFIREFMTSATSRFGSDTLLQFEDFATPNAIRLLDDHRDDFLCFNDDIQGTAAMTLAGVLAALGDDLHNHTFLFNGAGSAGIGIAHMLALAIAQSGSMSLETARKRIWAVDSRGLVVKDRPKGGLAAHKLPFAHEHEPVNSLLEAVRSLAPTVLIGVSSQPGSFSGEVLELVASICDRPLIFALSNPTSKAECTAEEAYKFTGGRALYASGSPFDAVELDGQRFEPSQANNVYIFPGLGLGALVAQAEKVTDSMMTAAARALASCVDDSMLKRGALYPPLSSIRNTSALVAQAVVEEAFACGVAGPDAPSLTGKALLQHIQERMYQPFPQNQDAFSNSTLNNSLHED